MTLPLSAEIERIDPAPPPPACSPDARQEETNNQIFHWGRKPSSSALITQSMISAPAHSSLSLFPSLTDKDISVSASRLSLFIHPAISVLDFSLTECVCEAQVHQEKAIC